MTPRVVICMPVYRDVPAEAVLSLVRLLHDPSSRELVAGFLMVTDTYLSAARNQLLREARALSPTHLLWLDADMVVPPNAVSLLLRHRKGVVGGLYATRRPPQSMVLRKTWDWNPETEPFLDRTAPEEFSRVAFVGFGCVLTEVQVFRRIEEAVGRPVTFFSHARDPEGEDVYCCRIFHQFGEPIYLDPGCRCGHIGSAIYHSSSTSHA
jgi:hypothetical protein